MKLSNVLVVYSRGSSKEHNSTLSKVFFILKRLKIDYTSIPRDKLNSNYFKNKNLIIAVGGDGTFLRASHFIKDSTPILGVNSDPSIKEGFFMKTSKDDFEKKLRKIIKNKFKKIKL